jgi:hypothetical protein
MDVQARNHLNNIIDRLDSEYSTPEGTSSNDSLETCEAPHAKMGDEWARRYGIAGNQAGQSRPVTDIPKPWIAPLAPEFAPTDPTFGFSPGDSSQEIMREAVPTDRDLDRILLSERIQQSRFGGLRTFESVGLVDSVGANQPDGAGIRLNSDQWLPVFHQTRWRDLIAPLAESFILTMDPAGSGMDIWSVEVGMIWDLLQPCIETADRMMKLAAAKSPW